MDPDEVIKSLHAKGHGSHHNALTNRTVNQATPYSSRYATQEEIPKFRISKDGVSADSAYAMLKDELDLDGRPNLNLARCVEQDPLLCFA